MFRRSKWIDTKLVGVRAHKKAPRRKLYPTGGLTDAIAGGRESARLSHNGWAKAVVPRVRSYGKRSPATEGALTRG